jgi:2-polyprenyl-6-methoxyphenol hydroxylase-like FAD-dependent oxidoreductase
MMMDKRVLISGASVAGPALAFWLGRAGYDVTVVERAPKLCEGGYAVDFRGKTHFDLLERMGVLDELRALQTHGGAMRFVDQRGKTRLFLPAEFAGGDLEVRRADLARVLYEHSRAGAEYVFGDSVATLRQDDAGVDVTFERAPPKRFDLVIGADGIHSKTRRLLFGQSFETYLGYYVASWDVPALSVSTEDSMLLNAPGRMIGITPPGRHGTAPGMFCIFAAPKEINLRGDTMAQKALLRSVYGKLGWRVPELLKTLDATDDVYLSPITRAESPAWSKGRIALLGDAAAGVAIGGMGTGMALIGAYVLANELLLTPGDPTAAFARYEQLLAGHVREIARSTMPGPFLAPRTRRGLFFRNTLLSFPPALNWLIRESARRASDVPLPDYGRVGVAATEPCPAEAQA